MGAASPAVAVIGGTGLNQWLGESLRQHSETTPYGKPSAAIDLVHVGECTVAFLPRHGSPHRIPPHCINYRANMWALKELGIGEVIAVNAVGGIRANMVEGVLTVPDQIVDYTYGREHTYADGCAGASLEHVDFSYPFDSGLRQRLLVAGCDKGIPVIDGAVYGATQGPRLETVAEINRMERDGCDIVGMTGMPEAALARELGLAYASLCLVVNPAAGRTDTEITLSAMQQVIEAGMVQVREIVSAAINSQR